MTAATVVVIITATVPSASNTMTDMTTTTTMATAAVRGGVSTTLSTTLYIAFAVTSLTVTLLAFSSLSRIARPTVGTTTSLNIPLKQSLHSPVLTRRGDWLLTLKSPCSPEKTLLEDRVPFRNYLTPMKSYKTPSRTLF